jgi:nitroreductase
MDAIDAIHSRRSARSYSDVMPDRALIEAVIWDAAQAPPPARGHAPSWIFNVLLGQARIAEYGARAKQHARENRPPGKGLWVDNPDFKVFWGAPALIIISSRSENPEAAFDCHRAGQNLMLSAHARGLATCWVGSPLGWLKTAEAKAETGIPAEYDAVAPIVIGYARETPAPRQPERPSILWKTD